MRLMDQFGHTPHLIRDERGNPTRIVIPQGSYLATDYAVEPAGRRHVDESPCAGECFDGTARRGVVVLDGAATTAAQKAGSEFDDTFDDGHAVRAAVQRVRRIILGHFGFQPHAVWDVGRVGDDEVDLTGPLCEQPGRCHVSADEFDRRSGGVAARIHQRVL